MEWGKGAASKRLNLFDVWLKAADAVGVHCRQL